MKRWNFCPYCGEKFGDCECVYPASEIENGLPEGYATIDYTDFETAEAIDGARFDDALYLFYTER